MIEPKQVAGPSSSKDAYLGSVIAGCIGSPGATDRDWGVGRGVLMLHIVLPNALVIAIVDLEINEGVA